MMIVIPRRDDQPDPWVEPLGGQLAPALRLGRYLDAEQLLERRG
jgi:hypothetical protein